jgi:hypothetical protein
VYRKSRVVSDRPIVGMRRLTVSKTDEKLILHLKTLIRKNNTNNYDQISGCLINVIFIATSFKGIEMYVYL